MGNKKIIILGSTGSIGRSGLDVLREHRDEFVCVGLSAHRNEKMLLEQAEEFGVKRLALSGKVPDSSLVSFGGEEGLFRLIEETDADLVLNGIAGSDGLLPSAASLDTGKNLALANKETVVMAGKIINRKAGERGLKILPVDSEHSAVFHLLRMIKREHLAQIILTASGGAFRDHSYDELENVSVTHALDHPTWEMGVKITIDSASMANKGLEVIEAHHLFDVPVGKIKVVIHPQSIVHSLIKTVDGSLYAQIGNPDMRLPIQNAFTYPDLWNSGLEEFDIVGKKLEFFPPDYRKYRMLALAYEVAGLNSAYSIVYNASNEAAVEAFLQERIKFTDIPAAVEEMLQKEWGSEPESIQEVLAVHREAVRKTEELFTGALP